ncbi:MAG: hypothetical protein PHZ26_03455 [Candidatus Gracilibacteria bacterium]|nr:hypothetical protein [Candidatus Gracilibacteria bacterium]
MKKIFSAHELIINSQFALNKFELIQIAIKSNCPVLAQNEARDNGFYYENKEESNIFNIKFGKPGARSVFYLTILKEYFPELFWKLIKSKSQ